MSSLGKAIYEHLITKKKYNRKCIELDVAKEDIQRHILLKAEQKKLFNEEKELWEQTLKEQEEEIIKLKKKLVKVKNENKEISKKEI